MKIKSLILVAGVVIATISVPAYSDTSIVDYVKLREKAVDADHSKYSDQANEKLARAAEKLMQDVRSKLVTLVGSVNVAGFPNKGKSVLGSRDDDQYDGLDGVEVKSFNAKTQLFVTTVPILKSWLVAHRKDLKHDSSLQKLLGTEEFYNATATLNGDAAIYAYGQIPVAARGDKSVARAIVFATGQGDPAPNPPDNLAVTVMRGDRIFILTEKVKISGIPACLVSSQQASSNYQQCFARKLASQSEYPQLINQAQGLVDRVPLQQH
ncbi:hypothetical protein WL26_17165 [Burkholderia cepacia]|uniref:hypothetical protein n=1 Tax=Burkholderia cepacia TaxID=292 RepID=UPI00075C8358|nr:hypothetical protein [Burkholderia cepacia]KWA11042.1 hypothetical protein WL26_17165 [Burkholderia cepacia]